MAVARHENGYFLRDVNGNQSDGIAAPGGTVDLSGVAVRELETHGISNLSLQLQATGQAFGSAGNVTFVFVPTLDGTNYDTSSAVSKTLALSGIDNVKTTHTIDVSAYLRLKVLSITNGDNTYAISGVNVYGYGEDDI